MSASPAAGSSFRQWVKSGRHSAARWIFRVAKAVRSFQPPVLPDIHGLRHHPHRAVADAAGSVVTRNLRPFVLAGGVPARVLRPLTSKETSDVA